MHTYIYANEGLISVNHLSHHGVPGDTTKMG